MFLELDENKKLYGNLQCLVKIQDKTYERVFLLLSTTKTPTITHKANIRKCERYREEAD